MSHFVYNISGPPYRSPEYSWEQTDTELVITIAGLESFVFKQDVIFEVSAAGYHPGRLDETEQMQKITLKLKGEIILAQILGGAVDAEMAEYGCTLRRDDSGAPDGLVITLDKCASPGLRVWPFCLKGEQTIPIVSTEPKPPTKPCFPLAILCSPPAMSPRAACGRMAGSVLDLPDEALRIILTSELETPGSKKSSVPSNVERSNARRSAALALVCRTFDRVLKLNDAKGSTPPWHKAAHRLCFLRHQSANCRR